MYSQSVFLGDDDAECINYREQSQIGIGVGMKCLKHILDREK